MKEIEREIGGRVRCFIAFFIAVCQKKDDFSYI